LLTGAYGQLTPSQDSYTNTATPTTNFGAKTLLDVESSQTTYIQFDLSAIPAGYTSANITKATLKLYVNAVTTAGSFNVDYVNGVWTESKIDASNAPALGTTIAASVPLTTADKNQYILIDITPAVQAWLSGTPNDGIALVANSPLNASFDSKESTSTSHSPELDIVFAGGGTLTGVTTASGSGLTGGGTSGTLNLSLTNACATNQVLQWNGSAWICASAGTGTVTSVGSGAGLTGGPITGSGTLSLDTTKVPLLAAANTFTANQTVNGTLSATRVVSGSVAIGTTAPTHALEVSSAGATAAQMAMVSSGSDAAFSLKNTASGGREYWIDSGSNGAGVGAGNFAVYDSTAGVTRLVVSQAGNVGIGTTAPQYTLDVHGTGNFTGNVTFTGNQTVSGDIVATSSTIGLLGVSNATSGTEYGVGGLASSPAGYGVWGFNTASGGTGVFGVESATSGTAVGVYGSSASSGGYGVEGLNTASSGGIGVYGVAPQFGLYGTATGSGNTVGVYGSGADGLQGSGSNYGVYSATLATGIAGTYGLYGAPSTIGKAFKEGGGVWADTNWDGDASGTYIPALAASADANIAGLFWNNSNLEPSVYAKNNGSGGGDIVRAEGAGGSCALTGGGDAACTGVLKSVVATTGSVAARVETYSVQSAENWFEDAGTAQLVNGAASVNLESVFGQTVNTGVEYHVFLTPDGDCKGLYVSAKTASGFEVRELGGGASSIAFEYRIMAKRVGYENVRLKDVTERFNQQEARSKNITHPARPSAEPQSGPEMSTPPVLPVRAAAQSMAAQPK
jgi:hypothetical protein